MVQLFPTARPLPQLFCSRKSPLTVMPEILSLEFPSLVSLTFLGELVLPTCSEPKFRAVGRKSAAGVLKYKRTTGTLEEVWPGTARSLTPSELKSPANPGPP